MLPYYLTTHPLVCALRRPWKIFEALLASFFFGFPSCKLRIIGVTGTTGKTTTIHLTAVALESAGYTVGVISSIQIKIGTKVQKNESGLTSLGPWQLQQLLARMVRSGCHYAVLEASSHALDQQRFFGVQFDVAVVTNISRDHLDYHRTLGEYIVAKRRLFRNVAHRRRKVIRGKYVPRVLVVSLDDPKIRSFLDEPADIRFAPTLLDPSIPTPSRTEPVYLYGVRMMKDKIVSVVFTRGQNALLYLRLGGSFNIRNALNAVAVGVSQGISLARITRELYEVRSIPGRFEKINLGQPFQVIVDYAVTEAALRALYEAVTGLKPRRVLAVFGAAGNRDRGKRPGMAAIVGKYADLVFLTNEDPFSEDPEQIFADLEKGLEKAGCKKRDVADIPTERNLESSIYFRIPDRREAIREAIHRAQPGDVIVATGKGAEETMHFRDRTIPWSDRKVFEEELRRAYGTSH